MTVPYTPTPARLLSSTYSVLGMATHDQEVLGVCQSAGRSQLSPSILHSHHEQSQVWAEPLILTVSIFPSASPAGSLFLGLFPDLAKAKFHKHSLHSQAFTELFHLFP